MANKKNLGVYWGNTALYFVETQGTDVANLFQIPFGDDIKEILRDGPSSLGAMELKSNIQKILRQQNLLDATVSLSLPANDIIFRSFIIPWMEPHEVKSVVEFEVSKYIPFPLERLAFAFHPVSFRGKDSKQIRIIFVAIQKNILSRYIKILENTSLSILLAEPASSSLIRALNLKLHRIMPKNKPVAIIEKEEVGRITIVDDAIPQFVREFPLIIPEAQTEDGSEGLSPEDLLKRLIGEVRISLEYFNRQNEQLRVSHAVFLSDTEAPESTKVLESSLPISIIPIEDKLVLEDPSKKDLGYLNAYGAGISAAVDTLIRFNFSKDQAKKDAKRKAARIKTQFKPINYKRLITTAIICIPLIVGALAGSRITKQKFNEKIDGLIQSLGSFQDVDAETINKQEKELSDKLNYFNEIRLDSQAASFLYLVAKLLPTGAWLEKFTITYDDSASFDLPGEKTKPKSRKRRGGNQNAVKIPKLGIKILGYAYSEDTREQFQLISLFLSNLRSEERFSTFFDNIDLETTKAQKIGAFDVTQFQILCTKGQE